MKIIKRIEWTSQYPQSNTGTEDMDGPAFFRDKDVKGLSVYTPNEAALFVELNPFCFLETQRKQDYTQRGYGDIQFNLAVAPNVEGVFCLRGLCNKSPANRNKSLNNHFVSVLCLLGTNEPPTDLLLQNLTACRELVLSRWPEAKETNGELGFDFLWDQPSKHHHFSNKLPETYAPDPSVHVFELIENLAYWGYYKGRNDGVYGPVTTNAVALLQADLADGSWYRKRVTGVYDRYTREAFGSYMQTLE